MNFKKVFKKIFNVNLIGVLVILVIVGSWAAKYLGIITPPSFSDVLLSATVSPAAFMSDLQQCMSRCSERESEMAVRMQEIMQPVLTLKGPEQGEALVKALPRLTAVIEEAFLHYEQIGDQKNLIKSYSAALTMISTLKLFGHVDETFVQKVVKGIREMPKKYPQDPKAYQLLGNFLGLSEGDTVEKIQAFYTCYRLDPKNMNCKKGYEVSVASYTTTKCPGDDVAPDFALFLSTTAKSKEFPKVAKSGAQTIYLESKPSIDANDIEFVNPTKDVLGQESLNVVLNRKGALKLADVTEKNVGKTMAISLKEKILAVPTIRGKIANGAMNISDGRQGSSGPSLFEQVCLKPVTPKLPENLRL